MTSMSIQISQNEIDELSTRVINARYKIDGYKFGRKAGELKFYPCNKVEDRRFDDIQESLYEIKDMLEHIMKNMATNN
ncbi:hypothetical protein QTN25_010653 [Entamoeba marina]